MSAPPMTTFEWQKLIRDVEMPPAVKNVAGWICSFADADGTRIYPGLARLMLATGLSRATTVQALTALRESGLLVRTKRGGGRGSDKSDEYQIGVPAGCGSPEQLGELVAAAYESAKPNRKSKQGALYESAQQTRKDGAAVETSLICGTYEFDLRAYESAGQTPPPRDHPVDQPDNGGTSSATVTVEGAAQAVDEPVDTLQGVRWKTLAARQLVEARAARGAS